MELLNILELKINGLIEKINNLEQENHLLRTELKKCIHLETENAELRTQLEKEKSSKQEIINRIDLLLNKLKNIMPEQNLSQQEDLE